MISARLLENEDERVKELLKYDMLDTPEEEEFNDIVKLASDVCNAPIALISLIDSCRQWFKAEIGAGEKEVDRDISFCAHALHYDKVMVVEDARKDERFHDNPFVIGGPKIRFYAGSPLVSPKGYKLGTLCILDKVPRTLSEQQEFALETLSRHIVQKFELRRKNEKLSQLFQQYANLQHEFEHRKEAYSKAQHTAGIGSYEYEIGSRKLVVSESLRQLYGFPSAYQVEWNDFKELVYSEDLEGFLFFFRNALQNEKHFVYEYRSLKKSTNQVLWIRSTGEVVRDGNNDPYKVFGAKQDITEIKKNEEDLKKQNDELQKVNNELDHFVSRVSHDLRAPISTVLGLIELIIRHESDVEKIKELLVLVKKSLEKQDMFIRDILDYSRNSRMPTIPERINFEEMVTEIFSHLQYSYDSEKVKYTLDVEQNSSFKSDKSRLYVILTNLISNAIKYLNQRSEFNYVLVSVKVSKKEVIIRVEDTGIGIEEKHLPRVFDMFYRATDKKPGSGLGLYIVKESVKKLGGSIQLQSIAGEGTKVHLTIPNLNHEPV